MLRSLFQQPRAFGPNLHPGVSGLLFVGGLPVVLEPAEKLIVVVAPELCDCVVVLALGPCGLIVVLTPGP